MTTVDPVYTPTPISQRDGSALANSNCRMGSIATGIDYETRGATRSTASKMRSYTSDQSGGTDSGDAVESWRQGYSRTLTVRDGYTFDNLLSDLRKGSGVNLDVWHATCGGPCLSGSGAYGHNIYIHPDEHSDGAKWRVADPWCSPGSWSWWPESKLRAGAEEWGRRVYGTAVYEAGYPTAGVGDMGNPRDPAALAIARLVVRRLMSDAYPGREYTGPDVPTPPDWGDTGGGKPILYTRTSALGVASGGGNVPGLKLTNVAPWSGVVEMVATGASAIVVADKTLVGLPAGATKPGVMLADLDEDWSPAFPRGTAVVGIGDDLAVCIVDQVELHPDDTGGGGDGEDPDAAYARGRADEWAAWADGLGIPDPPAG